MKYDYLIVGSGLFGSIFAYEMNKIGKKCKVIEKRDHIGGNIYTSKEENIRKLRRPTRTKKLHSALSSYTLKLL